MTKQKNILGEVKRKKNNKKIKKATFPSFVTILRKGKPISNGVIKLDLCDKLQEEMSLTKAIVIVATAILVFTLFPLLQRAVDIKALQNCEAYGDCSEVIRK